MTIKKIRQLGLAYLSRRISLSELMDNAPDEAEIDSTILDKIQEKFSDWALAVANGEYLEVYIEEDGDEFLYQRERLADDLEDILRDFVYYIKPIINQKQK